MAGAPAEARIVKDMDLRAAASEQARAARHALAQTLPATTAAALAARAAAGFAAALATAEQESQGEDAGPGSGLGSAHEGARSAGALLGAAAAAFTCGTALARSAGASARAQLDAAWGAGSALAGARHRLWLQPTYRCLGLSAVCNTILVNFWLMREPSARAGAVASAVRRGADMLASSLERHVAPTGEALDAFAAAMQALQTHAAETTFDGATECALPTAPAQWRLALLAMHVRWRTLGQGEGLGITEGLQTRFQARDSNVRVRLRCTTNPFVAVDSLHFFTPAKKTSHAAGLPRFGQSSRLIQQLNAVTSCVASQQTAGHGRAPAARL